MRNFKKQLFIYLVINILGGSFEIVYANNSKKLVLLSGVLGSCIMVNQIHKAKKEFEKNNPFLDQTKIHDYLEQKIAGLTTLKSINVPLVARLILNSKEFTPSYKEYDRYLDLAYQLAQKDKQSMSMDHIESAVHEIYGEKIDLELDAAKIREIAIHELGHAYSIVHKLRGTDVLHYVEVESRATKSIDSASLGHNVKLPIRGTSYVREEEWENQIIVALSGGIANQVIKMNGVQNKSISDFLSDEGCIRDIDLAFFYAEKIAALTF